VPEDFEPAANPDGPGRNWQGAGTTIDEKLLRRVVETYLGTPYRRGGDNLRGIDCSNLVHAIYRDYDGTDIPDNTRRLFRLPDAIVESDLQVGDLVFFSFAGTRSPSHVGVYLGKNEFVHASETAGVVISSLDEAVYRDAYSGARRVAPRLHTGE
jgi:lipoprotein Spr